MHGAAAAPARQPSVSRSATSPRARRAGTSRRRRARSSRRFPGTIAVLGDIAYENGTQPTSPNCFDPSWGRSSRGCGPRSATTSTTPARRAAAIELLRPPARRVVQLLARRLARDRAQLELQRGRRLRAGIAAVALAAGRPRRAPEPAARSPTGITRGSAPACTAPMRRYAPFWDLLARARADLVLSGHDHDYERFAPSGDPLVRRRHRRQRAATPSSCRAPGSVVREQPTRSASSRLHAPPRLGYDWRFLPVAGEHVHATRASARCR